MNFLQKLDYLMEERGINRSKLSKISGVPYTTIDGFYKKGYENAKLSTIRKISDALAVSLDYLIDDELEDDNPSNVADAMLKRKQSEGDILCSTLLTNFDQLNQEGREKLVGLSDDLVATGKYIKNNSNELGKAKNA